LISVDSRFNPAGDRLSQLPAQGEDLIRDAPLRTLRNYGIVHLFKLVAEGDALYAAKGSRAVVPRADKDNVRLPEYLSLRGIKGAVKEVLDGARHIPEVFRGPDGEAVAGKEVFQGRICRLLHHYLRVLYARRPLRDHPRHLLGVSRL